MSDSINNVPVSEPSGEPNAPVTPVEPEDTTAPTPESTDAYSGTALNSD